MVTVHNIRELSRFAYCLLQKITASASLLVVERWELYMLASHSSFAPIEEENFLVGSRLLESLSKLKSPHYQSEVKRDCRGFLEEYTSTVLSTVAARSPIAQGLS